MLFYVSYDLTRHKYSNFNFVTFPVLTVTFLYSLIIVKLEKHEFEKSLLDSREYFESEIKALVEEKNTFQHNYDQMKKHYEEEVMNLLVYKDIILSYCALVY